MKNVSRTSTNASVADEFRCSVDVDDGVIGENSTCDPVERAIKKTYLIEAGDAECSMRIPLLA